MEKTASPPESKTVSPETKQSPPIPSSASDHPTNQQFASTFTSLYHSIFPPKHSPLPISLSISPSTSSPSSVASTANEISTEHRLHQARLILEYQELCDHFESSLTRLETLTEELQTLRLENADLRLANSELIKILSLSTIQTRLTSNLKVTVSDFGPATAIEPNRLERARNTDRVSLPKSISVRSSGYTKPNHTAAANVHAGNKASTRLQLAGHLHHLVSESKKVFVPGGGGKRPDDVASAIELDVYSQGMWKTELCNKWQESGTCPYGDNCQFAHGLTELRPVMRHPRYKTQACRMVLAGDICPYGHRCHFRHSLSEQERLLLDPR